MSEEPAAPSGGLGSDLDAKKREFLRSKQELERGITETQQAAKKAEDETTRSVSAMRKRLIDLQRKADSLWRDSKKDSTPPDLER